MLGYSLICVDDLLIWYQCFWKFLGNLVVKGYDLLPGTRYETNFIADIASIHVLIIASKLWAVCYCVTICGACLHYPAHYMLMYIKDLDTLSFGSSRHHATITCKYQQKFEKLFVIIIIISGYVKNNYPMVEIMMWDDMFRSVNMADIEKSKVNRLVTPVVWKYTRDLTKVFRPDMWTKYGKLFHSIWFGSAFKGRW